MRSVLKLPGTKRLQMDFDKLLSIFAFNFDLRCYTTGEERPLALIYGEVRAKMAMVGRCRLTLTVSKPVLNLSAPTALELLI
jgi:hypothetical protein